MTLEEAILAHSRIETALAISNKGMKQLILKYNFSNSDLMGVFDAPLHYVQNVRRKLKY